MAAKAKAPPKMRGFLLPDVSLFIDHG